MYLRPPRCHLTAPPFPCTQLFRSADAACRRILAKQRRLRTAQHFDTLDVRKVADLGGRARAIDAVDEDADRRFDPCIVRAVAEAADDEVGVGARLELRDAKAGIEPSVDRKSTRLNSSH